MWKLLNLEGILEISDVNEVFAVVSAGNSSPCSLSQLSSCLHAESAPIVEHARTIRRSSCDILRDQVPPDAESAAMLDRLRWFPDP